MNRDPRDIEIVDVTQLIIQQSKRRARRSVEREMKTFEN